MKLTGTERILLLKVPKYQSDEETENEDDSKENAEQDGNGSDVCFATGSFRCVLAKS